MSQKRTLEKCRKIIQMFQKQKSKQGTAIKERPESSTILTSNKKTKPNQTNRYSFCLPSKAKDKCQSKNSLKPSFNKSTSSINSAQKSYQNSATKSVSKNKFTSIYNTESRYDKIMKLKVKPDNSNIKRNEDNRNSYLNNSKISFRSSASSIENSLGKQTRFDRIMKLKVHKPKVDSTLRNYQPQKQQKKVIHKENVSNNTVLQLKKCKQIIKKQSKQIDKQDRLWKVFERERQLRLKQKQKKEKMNHQRQRSLEKRFDALVQKQLKKIQLQKQIEQRRLQGFSTYLFPSY